MMRIGMITGEYPPMQGGVGAYTQILARRFADLGHEVFLLAPEGSVENDTRLHLSPIIRRWNLAALRSARRWARQNQLDIVNLQFETAAYGMSPWVHFLPEALRPLPLVTCFHDLLVPYLFPKAGPLRRWIVMRLARASAGVIATNHEDMMELAHLPRARLIPIGSNVDPSAHGDTDIAATRAEVGANDDTFLIAHFGFINHSKGIETLLRAASLLRDAGFPARLLMIGGKTGSSDPSNAAYSAEIDRLIAHLHLEEHIHWTGFVDDAAVTRYLHAADAVVLPFRDGASYRRGSLMAAIQHGCKIVTTQPAVEIDNFVHGENMLLFPVGDIEALMVQIRALAGGEYSTIAAGAAELARDFDWNQIARDCVTLFEEVRRS